MTCFSSADESAHYGFSVCMLLERYRSQLRWDENGVVELGTGDATAISDVVASLPDLRVHSFDISAPVNITDPAEQLAVEGDVLLANGTMASYVNEVAWSLRSEGGDAVLEGIAEQVDITGPDARATLGSPGWETGEIDVSGLAPGDYVFVAAVTDTGQTSDQPVEFSDTRTIAVR